MTSRLLSHLDAAIAAASQPAQADCLRAERAGLLARQGQLAEARAVVAALQAQYGPAPHPQVSAWIALTEGLVSYFSDMSRGAHDKVRRAHAVSAATRDTRLQALTAAWLAHMEYTAYELEPMGQHVAEALHMAGPQDHGARARACLVAAMAFHFGGRFDAAQPWYAKARLHASAEGDESMLSAIMYNMAGLLIDQSRQVQMSGGDDAAGARRAMLSLDSSSNLDALVGMGTLDALVPLHRARAFTLQERWAEAVALYEAHFSDGLLQGLDRMRASLGADLAWCRVHLGQDTLALNDALAAEVSVDHDRDTDDRAAAHSRLAQVFERLGEAGRAARHRAQAGLHWQAHEREQALAVDCIERALASISR
jgi:hypothetical protein